MNATQAAILAQNSFCIVCNSEGRIWLHWFYPISVYWDSQWVVEFEDEHNHTIIRCFGIDAQKAVDEAIQVRNSFDAHNAAEA
jgi:hypothetical protein